MMAGQEAACYYHTHTHTHHDINDINNIIMLQTPRQRFAVVLADAIVVSVTARRPGSGAAQQTAGGAGGGWFDGFFGGGDGGGVPQAPAQSQTQRAQPETPRFEEIN
eukprot:CAMPEP_0179849292 /NCGR_PEP_ID=MMETSP0982-20121206/7079_1 /TAXON_ID=483367 /ORGANISM="non described non described, Strain CCMP 2436" /LENGTH=106 /DNA_ID=CAMNT_0021734615 /DNA_START=366 /DNA_END=686 /DNA_ORIENTATION=-